MKRYNKPDTQDLEEQKPTINISEQNKYNTNVIESGESWKEGDIKGSPDIISYDSIKTIKFQMERCISKIKVKGTQGTAFFCKIPFPDEKKGWGGKPKKVLITNNHIVNQDLLNKPDSTISLLKNGDTNYINIKSLNKRMQYTDEKYDITIIELEEKEKDNSINFLELDKILINDIESKDDNLNVQFDDKTIYIIQYPKGNLSVSFGILNGIDYSDKNNFRHTCCTNEGSSGAPILNKDNKVIGIHKEKTNNNYNNGSFLNDAIKEFIKKNYKTKNEKALDDFNEKYKENIPTIPNIKTDSIWLANSHIGNEGFKELNNIEFKNCTKLKLELNNITSLESLTKNKSKNLEKLNLSNNSIKDIEPLKRVNFKKLQELNLSFNNISNIGVIEYLDLNKLKILNLGNNINIKHINSLDKSEFKELTELNLEGNKISDIKVFETVQMKKLESLNLRNNRIANIDVFKLAKFNGLKTLYLNENKIKDISILNDVGFKNELVYLDVSKNKIELLTDLFFDEVQQSKFDKLETFYANGNRIQLSDVKEMKNKIKQKCPKIKDLKIEEQEKKNN